MTTGMVLDIVVILLLIPTIVYAVILNRRLTALRRSRDELSKVVNSFNEATMRAEAGIPKLKKATTEANQTLKDRVDKAQTLRDDLRGVLDLLPILSIARRVGVLLLLVRRHVCACGRRNEEAASPRRRLRSRRHQPALEYRHGRRHRRGLDDDRDLRCARSPEIGAPWPGTIHSAPPT